jgi:hypothetical protein
MLHGYWNAEIREKIFLLKNQSQVWLPWHTYHFKSEKHNICEFAVSQEGLWCDLAQELELPRPC